MTGPHVDRGLIIPDERKSLEQLTVEWNGIIKTAQDLVLQFNTIKSHLDSIEQFKLNTEVVNNYLDSVKKTIKRISEIFDLISLSSFNAAGADLSVEDRTKLFSMVVGQTDASSDLNKLKKIEGLCTGRINELRAQETAVTSVGTLNTFLETEPEEITLGMVQSTLGLCDSLSQLKGYENLVNRALVKIQTFLMTSLQNATEKQELLVKRVAQLENTAASSDTRSERLPRRKRKSEKQDENAPTTTQWVQEMTDEDLEKEFSKGWGGKLHQGLTRRMRNTWRLAGRAARLTHLYQGFMGDFELQKSLRALYKEELGLKVLKTERQVRNAIERAYQLGFDELRSEEKNDLAFLAVFLQKLLSSQNKDLEYRVKPELLNTFSLSLKSEAEATASRAISALNTNRGFGDLEKSQFATIFNDYFNEPESGRILRSVLLDQKKGEGDKKRNSSPDVAIKTDVSKNNLARLQQLFDDVDEEQVGAVDFTDEADWMLAFDAVEAVEGWIRGETIPENPEEIVENFTALQALLMKKDTYISSLPNSFRDDDKYNYKQIRGRVRAILHALEEE